MLAPTDTGWASSTSQPLTTPLTDDSTSTVALSFSISARMSPFWTASPFCLTLRTSLPSAMSKPSLGIGTISGIGLLLVQGVISKWSWPITNYRSHHCLHRLDHLIRIRDRALLQLGAVGEGDFLLRHALDGRVEVVEAFFVEARGALGPDAVRAPALFHDDGAVGLLERLVNRLHVERAPGAQVNHFRLDALGRGLLGGRQGDLEHLGIGDEGHVFAPALHVALADGKHEVLVFRHLAALLIHGRVLDEEHRVVGAAGGL